MRKIFQVMLTSCLGCGYDAAFERASEHDMMFASGGPTEASGPTNTTAWPAEVTGDSEAVHTVTSASTGPDESSDGVDDTVGTGTGSTTADDATTTAGADEAVLHAWEASQSTVWELGLIELTAVVSANVTEVDVFLDEQLVVTLEPPGLTFGWEVTGELQDGKHTWSAVARTPTSTSAPRSVQVDVDVPAGGLPLWHEVEDDADLGLAAAVASDHDGAVVIGYTNNGVGVLTLRRYQGASIVWTRTAKQWSKKKEVLEGPSTGTDVAVDLDGNLLVAGNLFNGPRSYLAKLDPTGKLLWEIVGSPGEIANGVAVDEEGRVYLAGAAPVPGGDDTKLLTWSFNTDGIKPWLVQFEDKLDALHEQSERATAVARVGDRVIIVGEVEVRDNADLVVSRTIVLQATPGGEVKAEDMWISPGDWGGEDGAIDVDVVGDEYCLTGWSSTPLRALTRCSDGLQPWWSTRHEANLLARSISHNPRLEVVAAGENTLSGTLWVEALVVGGDEIAWTFTGEGADETLNGIDCGRWGPCNYAGMSAFSWMAGARTP